MSTESTARRRVILGVMNAGPDSSYGARITSLDEFNQCLDLFQQSGHREVDTARLYDGGRQESFTRETRWKERGISIASKWYPLSPGSHQPQVLREKLEESLSQLGTN